MGTSAFGSSCGLPWIGLCTVKLGHNFPVALWEEQRHRARFTGNDGFDTGARQVDNQSWCLQRSADLSFRGSYIRMTDLLPSLEAHRYLRAAMEACSWQAGWRSLLLRAYEDPLETEEFTTPATADHLIVLVTK